MPYLRYYTEIPGVMENTNQLALIDLISTLSEKHNFTGTLIFYHHLSLDPWMLTSRVIHKTERLIPLIAAQPYAIPPFSVAKKVATISNLYNRKVSLNLITGVSDVELKNANETIDPKMKYARLTEYIQVIKLLLNNRDPISYKGEFYNFNKLHLLPQIKSEHIPEIFMAGSSFENIQCAHSVADTTVLRPEPINLFKENYCSQINTSRLNIALRISIIARPTTEEAWEIARKTFPKNRAGAILTNLRKKVVSHNTRLMAHLSSYEEIYDEVYWMGAYYNGVSDDPYLVGSYIDVANYLKRYTDSGVNTILFGDLFSEEQFIHASRVIDILEL